LLIASYCICSTYKNAVSCNWTRLPLTELFLKLNADWQKNTFKVIVWK
jgi:hypothetical protein